MKTERRGFLVKCLNGLGLGTLFPFMGREAEGNRKEKKVYGYVDVEGVPKFSVEERDWIVFRMIYNTPTSEHVRPKGKERELSMRLKFDERMVALDIALEGLVEEDPEGLRKVRELYQRLEEEESKR